ncbi:hypothetical protein PPYR_00482 [Photinus pyralis]|uniref:Uncharacterized protein n=1 Tax=Photinus pyralis TaxID=7054 RepID=A0A5N4B1N5_PHOPY|nr:uncharacterized protein LOC116160272 [Photinus pyralis]XP_031329314.1 uncharacterized protein LOC116160283 [Photinus pyralis]KAB0803512.1 hypothetical protein PPYR_00482 [Photinus pyralis]
MAQLLSSVLLTSSLLGIFAKSPLNQELIRNAPSATHQPDDAVSIQYRLNSYSHSTPLNFVQHHTIRSPTHVQHRTTQTIRKPGSFSYSSSSNGFGQLQTFSLPSSVIRHRSFTVPHLRSVQRHISPYGHSSFVTERRIGQRHLPYRPIVF